MSQKETPTYKRKDKSLSLLAQRFLQRCVSLTDSRICLNETATELKVERRRLYDVINIMEALGVVSRKGQNCYTWKGLENMRTAVLKLKDEASGVWAKNIQSRPIADASKTASGKKTKTKGSRRAKSLGVLCENFIRLFFQVEKKNSHVSLDDAARALLKEEQGAVVGTSAFKSRVRRLYDIANVLAALGLIEKVFMTSSRKPAFTWVATLQQNANAKENRVPNATNTQPQNNDVLKHTHKRTYRDTAQGVGSGRSKVARLNYSKAGQSSCLSRKDSLTFSFSREPEVSSSPFLSVPNSAFSMIPPSNPSNIGPINTSATHDNSNVLPELEKAFDVNSFSDPFLSNYSWAFQNWEHARSDIESFFRNPRSESV